MKDKEPLQCCTRFLRVGCAEGKDLESIRLSVFVTGGGSSARAGQVDRPLTVTH